MRRHDHSGRFELQPYQSVSNPPMTPELAVACEQAIHVICADGRVLRAGRASLYILSGLGWRRWSAFFSLRPNVWLVELGYRIVASNRRVFGRLIFRK